MTKKTETHRIRGDWMTNGYINNLNRRRYLEILLVDGRAYDVDDFGNPWTELELTIDDDISGWGASTTFSPDAGEIDRIGRQCFKV